MPEPNTPQALRRTYFEFVRPTAWRRLVGLARRTGWRIKAWWNPAKPSFAIGEQIRVGDALYEIIPPTHGAAEIAIGEERFFIRPIQEATMFNFIAERR